MIKNIIFLFLFVIFTYLYSFNIEKFYNYNKCLGKRDGVSGCRTCCNNKYPKHYTNCVQLCMNY